MDQSYVKMIAAQMEQIMEDVANEYFFAFDLMECDQVHIDDVATDDNGQDLRYSTEQKSVFSSDET